MNFLEATKAMEEDKKVRMSNWKKNEYFYLDNGRFLNEENNPVILVVQAIMSNEWILFSENDEEWNLAEHWRAFPHKTQYHVAVKKCRDLILKDLNEWALQTGDVKLEDIERMVKERFGALE